MKSKKILILLIIEFLSVIFLNNCSLFSKKIDVSNSISLNNKKIKFNPIILWTVNIGNGIKDFHSKLSPAYAYDVVYAADREGLVKAVSIDNGKEIWSIHLSRKNNWFSYNSALLSSGITISNNLIYVGSEKAKLYAININSGIIEWCFNAAGEILSNVTAIDGLVLIHTSNGQLQAINEIDGSLKWEIKLGTSSTISLRGESTPAVILDKVIVGSNHGRLSAFNIQHGQLIWQKVISNTLGFTDIDYLKDVDVTPVIKNSTVYAIAYNGYLVALNLYNGHIIWKKEIGSYNNFIVNNNYIYLVDQNNNIVALNANNGKTIWIQNYLLNKNLTSPILYKDNLVIGDNKGYINWINPNNGVSILKQKIDSSGFITDLIVAKDKLIAQSIKGKLYAIIID